MQNSSRHIRMRQVLVVMYKTRWKKNKNKGRQGENSIPVFLVLVSYTVGCVQYMYKRYTNTHKTFSRYVVQFGKMLDEQNIF